MKQDFFNPWDARVQASMTAADERRRREIQERETGAPVISREEKHAVIVEADLPSVPVPSAPASKSSDKGRQGVPNTAGLRCPECGGIPKLLRGNGRDVSRHLPAKPGVKLYRDTEFCNGQGRPGVKEAKRR